jgi:hypothetical protein
VAQSLDVVQVVGPGTQVWRESQTMPAPQSASVEHVQLGTHCLVVGWQKSPGWQSLLVEHVVPLPPVAPGWQEWRVVSQVMPPVQSASPEQKPPSTQVPVAASQ